MFIFPESLKENETVEADICLVGSGAAGLPFALEFKDSPLKICIIESGDFKIEKDIQELNEVETKKLPIDPLSRVRCFGGTTAIWTGRWKPFDHIDMKKRDWVANSGWPIERSILNKYYNRAAKLLNVNSVEDFDESFLKKNLKKTGVFKKSGIEDTIFHWLEEKDWDWGKKFRSAFENSQNISVYLRSTVTKINSDGKSVKNLEVKTLDGKNFKVKAKVFALACGGIENARLMLASQIGNENVGRFYMDHPKGFAGEITLKKNVSFPAYFGTKSKKGFTLLGLRLSDELQKKSRVLNSYVLLKPIFPWTDNAEFEKFMQIFGDIKKRKIPKIGRENFNNLTKNLKLFASLVINKIAFAQIRKISVMNYMEQEPLPTNRVYLSKETDALGMPKAVLDWSIGELDKKSLITLHKYLKEAVEKLDIGEFESPLLEKNISNWPVANDASHPMGTTRMGNDSKTSVVDKNCKVHELDNLFIMGSSVFTTSGYANPTATIVALALRLADHLKAQLQ